MIYLITGGARSGKSSYAQKKALVLSDAPVYIATSNVPANDEEFFARIKRHRNDRDERWTTYEEPLYVSQLPITNKVVVVDCVTLWLANFFSLCKTDIDASLQLFQAEIDSLEKLEAEFFIVSNEIGMGLHAETEVGRKFTDLQGWANQYIAAKANRVVFLVSGIPLIIKEMHGS